MEFNKEVSSLELINSSPHPNIVSFLGYSLDPLAILVEFIDGGTLEHLLLDTEIEIDFLNVLRYSVEIASGMLHLHKLNIIHCDLASRNLLLRTTLDGYLIKN